MGRQEEDVRAILRTVLFASEGVRAAHRRSRIQRPGCEVGSAWSALGSRARCSAPENLFLPPQQQQHLTCRVVGLEQTRIRKCLEGAWSPGATQWVNPVLLTDVCRGGHEGDVSEPLREQGVRARSRACRDVDTRPPPTPARGGHLSEVIPGPRH